MRVFLFRLSQAGSGFGTGNQAGTLAPHQVIRKLIFVAQFGLSANPAIQQQWEKAPLKDEKVVKSNLLSWVGFAADGANSRTTQIYINLKDNKSLDGQGFPPFGDVARGIGALATLHSDGDKPNQQNIIKQGAAYLKRSFPQMDYVVKAVIE